MSNQTVSKKKKVGGIVLDVVTTCMLFAAFGAIFYSAFLAEKSDMPLGVTTAVTVVGLMLLFCIGTVSCMVTKVRQKSLTAGFLAFAAVQLSAVLVNFTVMSCLMIKLFTTQDQFMRWGYAVTVAIVLAGYVVSLVAYSGGILASGTDEENPEKPLDELSGEVSGEGSEELTEEVSGDAPEEAAEELSETAGEEPETV